MANLQFYGENTVLKFGFKKTHIAIISIAAATLVFSATGIGLLKLGEFNHDHFCNDHATN